MSKFIQNIQKLIIMYTHISYKHNKLSHTEINYHIHIISYTQYKLSPYTTYLSEKNTILTGSSIKLLTPCPTDRTTIVALPYRA